MSGVYAGKPPKQFYNKAGLTNNAKIKSAPWNLPYVPLYPPPEIWWEQQGLPTKKMGQPKKAEYPYRPMREIMQMRTCREDGKIDNTEGVSHCTMCSRTNLKEATLCTECATVGCTSCIPQETQRCWICTLDPAPTDKCRCPFGCANEVGERRGLLCEGCSVPGGTCRCTRGLDTDNEDMDGVPCCRDHDDYDKKRGAHQFILTMSQLVISRNVSEQIKRVGPEFPKPRDIHDRKSGMELARSILVKHFCLIEHIILRHPK